MGVCPEEDELGQANRCRQPSKCIGVLTIGMSRNERPHRSCINGGADSAYEIVSRGAEGFDDAQLSEDDRCQHCLQGNREALDVRGRHAKHR